MFFFDLHCDTVTEANKQGTGLVNNTLQLSIDRLCGSRWCQCFAIFMPDSLRGRDACCYFSDNALFFFQQMERYPERIVQVRHFYEIEKAVSDGKIAAILTVEGGSALAGDLSRVSKLRNMGVRMMTLTWNGENELASGNLTKKGFTPFGREAVGAMEKAGIVVDVSHLNDRGFSDLCGFAKRPFIASHSNARAVCNSPRNLTDDQFRQIVANGGMVGINFYVAFLSERKDPTFQDLAAHIGHFLKLGGEDALALGSDFDGADMPSWLGTVGQVTDLYRMVCKEFGAAIADKLFYENACRFWKRYDELYF